MCMWHKAPHKHLNRTAGRELLPPHHLDLPLPLPKAAAVFRLRVPPEPLAPAAWTHVSPYTPA